MISMNECSPLMNTSNLTDNKLHVMLHFIPLHNHLNVLNALKMNWVNWVNLQCIMGD